MSVFTVQLTFTLDENAAKSIAGLLAPAIKQAIDNLRDEFDQPPEQRLRASQNAIFGGEKPPEDQGLLIDSKQAAKLLKVSERTLWKMHHSGEMPQPIRIGRAVRWILQALKKWVDEGCPSTQT